MCLLALVSVVQLEEHRVGDVKSGELVEGGRWQEDFAAVIGGLSLRTRHHGDGIAAVVFVESALASSTREHAACLEHGHGVFVVAILGCC